MFVITHMDGLMPGANTLSDWWDRIVRCDLPKPCSLQSRWKVDRDLYYSETPGTPNKTYIDTAYVLDETLDCIGDPLEDRQVRLGRYLLQRLLDDCSINTDEVNNIGLALGTSWTAPSYFANDIASTFEGNTDIDLPTYNQRPADPERQVEEIGQGLGGPKLAVDTACASSLNALDSAMKLIDAGCATRMVVMGLNVSTPIFMFTGFSNIMALSPKAEIKPFASDSSGIMIGEMVGAVMIERIETARASGRPILAHIKGLGLSSDGADRSVFAPGPSGQRLAYERAYQNISVDDINYIEAHGTGTNVGDGTELTSLNDYFSAHSNGEREVAIGAVKSIVGHTLPAAGMASLLKSLLMIQHRVLPPHIDVNPHQALGRFKLLDEPQILGDDQGPLSIAISSHGFGGANAHLVIQSPPHADSEDSDHSVNTPTVASNRDNLVLVDLAMELGGGENGELPLYTTVESAPLRMGPKSLARVDGFQLFLIDKLIEIKKRLAKNADPEQTVVNMITNLGGDLTCRMSRRDAWLFWHNKALEPDYVQTVADALGPPYSMEAMASCMPSMCSGYPAYHLDFKGFHQTNSGNSDLFWYSLLMADQTLRSNRATVPYEFIYLGAGHLERSAIDGHSSEDEGLSLVNRVEGGGFGLLCKESKAKELGLDIIARITCQLTSEPVTRNETLADSFGISENGFEPMILEDKCRDFGEISGLVTLRDALMSPTKHCCCNVPLASGQNLLVSLEQEKQWQPRVDVKESPLKIELKKRTIVPLRKCVPEPHDSEITHNTKTVCNGHTAYNSKIDLVRLSLQNMASATDRYLKHQSQIINLISVDRIDNDTREDQSHLVLSHLSLDRSKRTYNARYHVNQDHPYFYDHPLDHIPGILLAEGIQQAAEMLVKRRNAVPFVSALDMRFHLFCDNNRETQIKFALHQNENAMDSGDIQHYEGEISQDNRRVVSIGFTLNAMDKKEVTTTEDALCLGLEDATLSPSIVKNQNTSTESVDLSEANLNLLHKQKRENVMISPLLLAQNQVAYCYGLKPKSTHLLCHSGGELYSPVYFFEIARQHLMLVAHQLGGDKLGSSMIWYGISLQLERPVYKHETVEVRFISDAGAEYFVSTQIADLKIDQPSCEFRVGEEVVGIIIVKAQVANKEYYQRQRLKSGNTKV